MSDSLRHSTSNLNRRNFLITSAAVGLAECSRPAVRNLSAAEPDASQVTAGKDRRLTVHKSEIPVLETPPELLQQQITPLNLLFVRNNQPLKNASTLRPFPLRDWEITVGGLVDRQHRIDAESLTNMDQVDREMVLQCCGNGRSLFAQTVQAKGTQWTRGGMGNVRVTGVLLSTVLEKLGVRVGSRARYLTAGGKDHPLPGKDDFEHSLPLDDVLQHSLLALNMNGRPIPAVHGGPVRLMTPGFYGTMHIKWLTDLRFEAEETNNGNHIPRYRTPRNPIAPGTPITYSVANSKACWRMKVKSVVLWPQPGAKLAARKQHIVRGVAFNDGSAPIESVLLSTDRGQTWKRARLEKPDSPYAWYRWTYNLKLSPGQHTLWTRAVDRLGRSQPLRGSIHWNPSGYEWNGVEQIGVEAT